MTAGVKILIFGNPIKFTHYMGQATLVSKISDWGWMERWKAQFDDEVIEVLISKKSNMKPIKGLEDYAISEDGQVYSFKKARLMRPNVDGYCGRFSIKLEKDGQESVYPVARLVMDNWSDPYPGEHFEIFHLDRNRANNHFSNLKWITHSQAKIYSHANRQKDEEIARTFPPPHIPLKATWIQLMAEKKRKKPLYFMSIGQAEEYLKISARKIKECMNENKKHDGWTFKKI